jgi:predicted aspartyl protease
MGCEEDHMSSITGIPARMIRAAADVTAPAIVTIIASITILMLAGAVLMPSAAFSTASEGTARAPVGTADDTGSAPANVADDTARASAGAALVDPYGILKKNLDEMGGIEKILSISTRYYEADITFMGMQGRVKAWEERPMMKRREMSLGVLRMTSGDNGDISWIVDPNGKLQVVKDETALERREIEALLEAYEHANPESKYFTLAFEGMEMVGDTECYVVKILNSINDDVRLRYFDHDTFLQVKAVDPEESFEVHTLLSDYRDVAGVKIPFHMEADIRPIGQKQIIQITKYQVDIPVDRELFDPPEQDADDFSFAGGEVAESVPFEYIQDHIYLDVTISGLKSTWVLDTGASATVVDSTFAADIGLPSIGKAKAIGAGGTVDVNLVTLPPLRIQGIRLDEQQVGSIPLRELFGMHGLEIDGVLGYDFLSRFVTRIDYANTTMTFYDPESFVYTGDGAVIEAPLAHRLFSLPVTLDGVYQGDWTLDIGASISTLQYPFAKEHGLLNLEGVERLAGGAGGQIRARVSEFESLELGGFTVKLPLILVPLEDLGAFSLDRGVGILGNSTLRRFVIYLDYANQRVIIERGRDFETAFPRDKSGMSIAITPGGDYQVLSVSAGGPAADAGLLSGDIVQSINGIEVERLGGPTRVSDLFSADAGTVYELEILREDKPMKIAITLRDLY